MKLERIIEILEKHQEWRRDQNVPPKIEMQSPIEIGNAIDYALSELKKLRLGVVSNSEVFEHYGKPFTSGRDLWDFLTAHYNFTPKT